MDRSIHQRVCNMPAKQNNDTQKPYPTLLHYHGRQCITLPAGGNGPHHRPPETQRERCDPNHCRSRVLVSGHLPPLRNHHYGPGDSPTIYGPHIQMVWTPPKSDIRPRPPLHIPLRKSDHTETRGKTKPIHGLLPTNRWSIRTEEPMGQAIFTSRNVYVPGRLDTLAGPRISSSQ